MPPTHDPPTDPESAALRLLAGHVRTLIHTTAQDAAVADVCARLRKKHVLAGLCGHDANLVASLVAVALCRRIDLGDYLRDKARAALSGTDGVAWRDRDRVAQAYAAAADELAP
jgi:hypothetical protein